MFRGKSDNNNPHGLQPVGALSLCALRDKKRHDEAVTVKQVYAGETLPRRSVPKSCLTSHRRGRLVPNESGQGANPLRRIDYSHSITTLLAVSSNYVDTDADFVIGL